MAYRELRQMVHATARQLYADGLVRLSAGNVSARDAKGFVGITPADMPYDRMRPEDIVVVDLEGRLVDGARQPSSETPLHTAILRAVTAAGAVVHTHSIYAIAFAVSGVTLPPVCLELLAVGAPVPVAPYACPGTAEAGEVAAGVFAARPGLKCLLLRNHGVVAIGSDLEQARQHALQVEIGAQIYHLALQTGSPPVALSDEQVGEIDRRYRRR